MVQATSCALTPLEAEGTEWDDDPLQIFASKKAILLEPDPVLIKGQIYLHMYVSLNTSEMLINQSLMKNSSVTLFNQN